MDEQQEQREKRENEERARKAIPKGRKPWVLYQGEYLVAGRVGDPLLLDTPLKLEAAAKSIRDYARAHRDENSAKRGKDESVALELPDWWAKGATKELSPDQRGNQSRFAAHAAYSGANCGDWWNLGVVLRHLAGLAIDYHTRGRKHRLVAVDTRTATAKDTKKMWHRIQQRDGKRAALISPAVRLPTLK